MPEDDNKPDRQTAPATDPTGIGPPPPGAKVSPDGKVTPKVEGTTVDAAKR